ncbi:hypothetical protein Tco_0311420 [Tanacetum coccineum]
MELFKERFSLTEPTNDKERTLWVELKRLFEPNTDDTLWKLQRYMHDPLKWRLYDTCGVHHVSTERGIDIFMLVEKEYPLSKGVLTLMLVNRLSTNAVNTAYGVSTANTQVSTARLFSPLNLDLSNSGLEEFQQPEFEGYGPKTSKSVSEDTLFMASWVCETTKLTSASLLSRDHNYVDARGISKKNVPISQTSMILMEDICCPLGRSKGGRFSGKGNSLKLSHAIKESNATDHRRLGHVNFKTINKLVKDNLVKGTNSNDFIGTKESNGAGHSSKELRSSQDYILMPLWKDGLLFDSSSKDASNVEPQPSNDAEKKDDGGGINDQERTENSAQDVISPWAPLESTYADFFGDESELDLSNIATTYPVPSTLNTRIHKDHSLDHVIGDMQFGVQPMRMINKQGFISVVYEEKTHEDLHTCLFACFLSQEEPKRLLEGQPKLGLWYPKDSPFDLEAYTDSDYAGASLDRKSTTGGCQFLGRRLIS